MGPPPATRTRPSGSSVAVWPVRATARGPPSLQVLLPGSNSWVPVPLPTTSTLPLPSRVAVWLERATFIAGTLVQVLVPGL